MSPRSIESSVEKREITTGDALIIGAVALVATSGLFVYSLVKDSGATVADLGRDTLDGIKPRIQKAGANLSKLGGDKLNRVKSELQNISYVINDEVSMFNSNVLSHFLGDKK